MSQRDTVYQPRAPLWVPPSPISGVLKERRIPPHRKGRAASKSRGAPKSPVSLPLTKQHRPALATAPANHPPTALSSPPFTRAPCPNGTPYIRAPPWIHQHRPFNLRPHPNPKGIASPSPGLDCGTQTYPGSLPNKFPTPSGLRPRRNCATHPHPHERRLNTNHSRAAPATTITLTITLAVGQAGSSTSRLRADLTAGTPAPFIPCSGPAGLVPCVG